MTDATANQIECPLCHHLFEKRETPCGRGCPLGRYCRLICCPNCNFEFPQQRRWLSWLQRWFHRRHAAPEQCEVLSLCDLEVGAEREVACLVCAHPSRRNTLAVYGVSPGNRLVLQQKRPSYVIRVGETELALEGDIAREIYVKRVTPA